MNDSGEQPPQNDLQLVRHAYHQFCTCFRCGGNKTSTLVAHRVSRPEKLICNNCCWLMLLKADTSYRA
jgi:hypothetical protein